jgi:hypothetical protein
MLDRLPRPAGKLTLPNMSLALTHWPEMPAAPGPGQVAVVRIRRDAPRATLRQVARDCALRILRSWGHASASLDETTTGPKLAGCGVMALSLAYTTNDAWLALARSHSLGIDATMIKDFDERDEVSRIYLGPASATIADSDDSAAAFAAAWSRHEATLKYHRLPLTEWCTEMPAAPRHLAAREADIALSVVLDL